MRPNHENDPFDTPPVLKGYPRKDEPPLEDLPAEWLEDDRAIEGKLPDLGEIEEDTSEE